MIKKVPLLYKLITAFVFTVILTSSISYAQMAFTKEKAYELVQDLEKDDFVTKIDLKKSEIQVSLSFWNSIDLDSKRGLVKLFACYKGYKQGKYDMLSVSLVDDNKGTELGKYSVWSGVSID